MPSPSLVFALALAIGVIAGLRSLTAPTTVSLAARWSWINLSNSQLAFLGSAALAYVFAALAAIELVVDKLPMTPSRKTLPSLGIRLVTGTLSGAALCAAGGQAAIVGAVLGAVGSLIGTFGGYEVRHRLVQSLKVPDLAIALVEDAVAVAGGFLIVSRF